jgi:hypothetical protein
VDRRAQCDLERFKEFIEGRKFETGTWRRDNENQSDGSGSVDAWPFQGILIPNLTGGHACKFA